MNNRKQCVELGNIQSDFDKITCGVPQGSILGPLHFLLYINDMSECSSLLSCHLFADDTSIFYSHKLLSTLQSTLNTELLKVSQWLAVNKLSLNVSKSNVLLFRPKNCTNEQNIHLLINNEPVVEKVYVKYLGIYIDHKLTWEFHTDHVN